MPDRPGRLGAPCSAQGFLTSPNVVCAVPKAAELHAAAFVFYWPQKQETTSMGTRKPMENNLPDMTGASYAASGVSVVVGGLTLSEIGVIVGIAIAILTYLTNAVFQWLRYRADAKRDAPHKCPECGSVHRRDD